MSFFRLVIKGARFCRDWYKRSKKICRSFYYFGKFDVYVHGNIYVGNRKNVKIGEKCSVNRGVVIQGFNDIKIGKRVVLSVNCMILDGNLDHETLVRQGVREHIPSHVHIDDDVWIGAGSIILPGVTIGPRSIVAAGSVVTKSFPSDVVIAGNPAKVVKD